MIGAIITHPSDLKYQHPSRISTITPPLSIYHSSPHPPHPPHSPPPAVRSQRSRARVRRLPVRPSLRFRCGWRPALLPRYRWCRVAAQELCGFPWSLISHPRTAPFQQLCDHVFKRQCLLPLRHEGERNRCPISAVQHQRRDQQLCKTLTGGRFRHWHFDDLVGAIRHLISHNQRLREL